MGFLLTALQIASQTAWNLAWAKVTTVDWAERMPCSSSCSFCRKNGSR